MKHLKKKLKKPSYVESVGERTNNARKHKIEKEKEKLLEEELDELVELYPITLSKLKD